MKNKTMLKIREIVQDRIGMADTHFMDIMIINGLSTMATHMQINIEHFDGTKVPCNAYSLSLAPSGYNKGRLMNILEDTVFNEFREEYEDMFGSIAEANCTANAERDAARKGIDFEDAMESILKRWDRLPKPLYSFSDATEAGLKAVREKYTMAGLGGTVMAIDEIAYSLPKFEDVLTSMLEVYDIAKLKDKLIKVDSNGEAGRIPATLLMFGSPSSLLNGSKNEDDFIDMLRQGFARRMFFSYIKNYDKIQEETPEEIIRRAKASKGKESHFSCFKSLANKDWIGKTLTATDEYFVQLLNYKRACEKKAETLKSHQEIQLFEVSHRYWKVFKLSGLLSIAECRTSVTIDDLQDAISFAEESGSHFEQIMLREPNYIRLFNYIADVGTKVTEADLYSNLHFYSSSNSGAKKDMRNLAAAHAYNVGGVFKETSKNGVTFYEAELLKETDLNKLILSYSSDITTGYENVEVKFDELCDFVTTDGFHFVSHHLLDGYRKAENQTGHFNMIVLDVDHECSVELAMAMLKDYKYLLYTTKRHTDKEHRFRIVMPMKYNVKLNQEDYKRFMKNIFEWLPFESDEATGQYARKWLTNSGQLYRNEGILLDPTNFIPNTQKANETKRNIDDLSNMDSIERFFLMQLNDGSSRNNTIIKLGLMLVDSGYNYESIEDKLISFNDKMDEPLPVKEVMSTVMQTVRKKIAERDA